MLVVKIRESAAWPIDNRPQVNNLPNMAAHKLQECRR
jgi:hypothetical protein